MYIQKIKIKLYAWIKTPNENYIQVTRSQNKSKVEILYYPLQVRKEK
jgi:hypothetical protein